MNVNNIPEKLRSILPMVKHWGIEDDGLRDEKVYSANPDELKGLVELYTDERAELLDKWLGDDGTDPSTEEYQKFSAFYMALEYAESVYQKRRLS